MSIINKKINGTLSKNEPKGKIKGKLDGLKKLVVTSALVAIIAASSIGLTGCGSKTTPDLVVFDPIKYAKEDSAELTKSYGYEAKFDSTKDVLNETQFLLKLNNLYEEVIRTALRDKSVEVEIMNLISPTTSQFVKIKYNDGTVEIAKLGFTLNDTKLDAKKRDTIIQDALDKTMDKKGNITSLPDSLNPWDNNLSSFYNLIANSLGEHVASLNKAPVEKDAESERLIEQVLVQASLEEHAYFNGIPDLKNKYYTDAKNPIYIGEETKTTVNEQIKTTVYEKTTNDYDVVLSTKANYTIIAHFHEVTTPKLDTNGNPIIEAGVPKYTTVQNHSEIVRFDPKTDVGTLIKNIESSKDGWNAIDGKESEKTESDKDNTGSSPSPSPSPSSETTDKNTDSTVVDENGFEKKETGHSKPTLNEMQQ